MNMPHPPWFDPAMPARDACVLRDMLDRAAEAFPARPLVRFEDGGFWSYAEARRIARATAAGLRDLGVRRGDMVSVWLPNGSAALRAWFGINYLGAVHAPINTAYRGRLLDHVLTNTGAAVLIVHADLMPRLSDVMVPAATQIVVYGEADAGLPFTALDGDGDGFEPGAPLDPWDIQAVIYTSGTTGPSKGVLQTYVQSWTTGRCSYGYIGPEDRMLVNLPLFHVGGTSSVHAVLSAGASFALFESFSTARFWEDIRAAGATTTCGLIGAMAEFLMKVPPRADDADNPLRMLTMAPVNRTTMAFARRFGFDWLTGFNMTEVSVPLVAPINSTVEFGCGRPRSGITARLVDGNDIELPAGAVGELILRSDLPWTMTPGYLNNPEATARAWRNGWFHTGDAFRQDADGNFYFVDRLKDTIRRRGENVSSLEVEIEVSSHPAIQEAAAVGVASPHGEEDILVAVTPRPGMSIEPEELIAYLRPRMAHFMVPRYVRPIAALPKTPTNKVQKAKLRAEGVTADTWDRERAGIFIRKDRFTN